MKYDPWIYAREDKRIFIIPEDIQEAINASSENDLANIRLIVLEAIASDCVEDHKMCAFVAYEGKKE